jgi:GT2 family glycosyltransferase
VGSVVLVIPARRVCAGEFEITLTQVPTVSVVLATYGRPPYLAQAIESVLAQSFDDFELLVSDDSTGAAAEIVGAHCDPRLRYHVNEHTLGAAANHWAGFGRATAPYIAIINHDDYWAPTFLARLVAAIERDDRIVVAFSDHYIVDSQGDVLPEETDATSRRYGRELLGDGVTRPMSSLVLDQSIPMVVAALFRRDAFSAQAGELIRSAGPAYDLVLTVALCQPVALASYVGERLTYYRVHDNSQTAVASAEWPAGAARTWEAFAATTPSREVRRRARRLAGEAWAAASRSATRQRAANSRRYALRGLRHAPSPRTLAVLVGAVLDWRRH